MVAEIGEMRRFLVIRTMIDIDTIVNTMIKIIIIIIKINNNNNNNNVKNKNHNYGNDSYHDII